MVSGKCRSRAGTFDKLLETLNKFGRTRVVEVIVFDVVACDFAVCGDHVLEIGVDILKNGVPSMVKVGVEHTLQFNAYGIVPFGFLGEIEQPGLRIALDLGVGHPLGIGRIGIVGIVVDAFPVDVDIVIRYSLCQPRDVDRLFLHPVELAVANVDILHIDRVVETDDKNAIVALVAGHIFHVHIAHQGIKATITCLLRLIVEIDFQYGLSALSYFDIAHVDVLDNAAPAVVGLDTEDTVQVGRVHHAVFGIDILATAGDL